MFDIFKKLKQQKDELETLRHRYEQVNLLNELHCGWRFAYIQAITKLCENGVITNEQKNCSLKRP